MAHFTMGTGGHYTTMLPADWSIYTSHDPLPSSYHSKRMLWNPSIGAHGTWQYQPTDMLHWPACAKCLVGKPRKPSIEPDLQAWQSNKDEKSRASSEYWSYSMWKTVEIIGFIQQTAASQKYRVSQSGWRGKTFIASCSWLLIELLKENDDQR